MRPSLSHHASLQDGCDAKSFGDDINDLPLQGFQDDINQALLLLLHPPADIVYELDASCTESAQVDVLLGFACDGHGKSLHDITISRQSSPQSESSHKSVSDTEPPKKPRKFRNGIEIKTVADLHAEHHAAASELKKDSSPSGIVGVMPPVLHHGVHGEEEEDKHHAAVFRQQARFEKQ